MSKRHLYLLAFAIIALATSAIVYKWQVLKFPLQPDESVQVWSVQHLELEEHFVGDSSKRKNLPG